MSDDNPFDKLGLKKSVVVHLVRTGQLGDYLRDYFRITQTRVHPDKGGDTGLCAVINDAYSAIRQNPGKIDDWVAGMQNGNGNAERDAMIDALVERVKRLQGVEKENEALRRKCAELLAGGSRVDAEVKPARGRAAPRTPPRAARRVDPDPVSYVGLVDPILIEELVCVGSDGKVFERYDELLVDGDVVRNVREFYSGSRIHKHVSFTAYEAISYFEKHGAHLPDYPTVSGILEYVFGKGVKKRPDGTYETLDADAKAVLDQFKNYGSGYGWHAVNGVVDGEHDCIIHNPYDADFPSYGVSDKVNTKLERIVKPFKRGKDWSACRLETALEDKHKVNFLKDLTGRENLNVFLELSEYFGREPWFYPPAKGGVWSAWLGCGSDGSGFDVDAYDLLSNVDAARGVRRP